MGEERLRKARETIAEADREMAQCFVKRMEAAREIAAYKQERGLPVLDAAQEQIVIDRGLACIESDELRDFYLPFIRNVIEVSKLYQHRLLEGGHTGPETDSGK